MSDFKLSFIFLKRYFFSYLSLAAFTLILILSFFYILADSLQQYQSIQFFTKFEYDLIAPKGASIETLLFLQKNDSTIMHRFIPSNLYGSLKDNPAVQLIPFLKEFGANERLEVATDLSEADFKEKLNFLNFRKKLDFKKMDQVLSQDDIWGHAIVNLIFVKAYGENKLKLKEIVNKRTVAEYVDMIEFREQLFKLMGWSYQKMMLNWLLFLTLFSTCLVAFVLSLRPLFQEALWVLSRRGLKKPRIYGIILRPFLVFLGLFLIISIVF
jgi:hypothetical protein